jgi:hypothetical protein
MKSYGRAPTFLITTGNEQVRSIAVALTGDTAAADEVQLVLPETGVCSVDLPLADDTTAPAASGCCGTETAAPVDETGSAAGGCGTFSCGTTSAEAATVDAAHAAWANGGPRLGFATGVCGGRSALSLADVSAPRASGSCSG